MSRDEKLKERWDQLVTILSNQFADGDQLDLDAIIYLIGVQELGQFARRGLTPIVFVLNNDGYLIERLLCKDPDIAYNDLAPWNYTQLPQAFGCEDWLTLRVTTCAELDAAMAQARSATTGVYVEIVTPKYASSELALKLHDAMQAIYRA